jgi:hypothetical protein
MMSVAGPVDGLTPPVGDCATGAVTLSVEPSEAVFDVPPVFGVVGVRGVLEFDVHAIVNASSAATPVTATKFRDINSSRKRVRERGCVAYSNGINFDLKQKFARKV